jgi:hypothetical protein
MRERFILIHARQLLMFNIIRLQGGLKGVVRRDWRIHLWLRKEEEDGSAKPLI